MIGSIRSFFPELCHDCRKTCCADKKSKSESGDLKDSVTFRIMGLSSAVISVGCLGLGLGMAPSPDDDYDRMTGAKMALCGSISVLTGVLSHDFIVVAKNIKKHCCEGVKSTVRQIKHVWSMITSGKKQPQHPIFQGTILFRLV